MTKINLEEKMRVENITNNNWWWNIMCGPWQK